MPNELPRDGLVAVVKHDCPTCVLTAPVLGELARMLAGNNAGTKNSDRMARR